MFAELSIWQTVLLIGLALLALLYVYFFRIWATLAAGSDLLFLLALAIAVASVAAPALFDRAAAELVVRSALPGALRSADEKVDAIEALPGELIDRALARLGYEREEDELAVPEMPLVAGPFETRIRPAVETLLAVVLRSTAFLCSTLFLLLALAMRTATSAVRRIRSLSRRVERLEARTAPVEATLGAGGPR